MGRRAWFRLHSALGIFTGLMLFVLCWSGTIAVFSREIDWLLDPARQVTVRDAPIEWERMRASVAAAYPGADIKSLNAPLHPGFAAEVGIDKPDHALVRVWVDPWTGAIQGESSFFNVQRFFRSFHMSLFDVGGIGYWVVAVFAVPMLLSVLLPFVFYKRWWRGFTKLNLKRGLRTFMSDLHKLAGLWSLWFGLVIAITGGWWLFEYGDLDLGYPEQPEHERVAQAPPRSIDAQVASARAIWPEFTPQIIYLPNADEAPVVGMVGQAEANLVRERANRIDLDAATGEALFVQKGHELAWPARWIDTVDPVHFGDFGGLWSRAIWFLFGLLLTSLCLTGTFLHARRLQLEGPKGRSRWPGAGAGIAVSVVVLAASAYAGYFEIRGYGPTPGGVEQFPDIPAPVIAFIAVWIATTLAALAWWVHALRRAPARSAAATSYPDRQRTTAAAE